MLAKHVEKEDQANAAKSVVGTKNDGKAEDGNQEQDLLLAAEVFKHADGEIPEQQGEKDILATVRQASCMHQIPG